jgi:DNA-binding NarL/FixJ family response regulator
VTSVLQGRSYFPIDLLHGRPERKVSTHKLTNREMTVLQMLIQGKRVRDIAMQLMLSHKTISTHKYRIMQKMGVASFAELVHAARKMGVHVEFDA